MAQREALNDNRKSSVAPSVSSAAGLVNEEINCNGELATGKETSQFQLEGDDCLESSGSGTDSRRQVAKLKGCRGACVWQKVCADPLLVVAGVMIAFFLGLLIGFVVLFNVRPGESGTQGSATQNTSVDQNACQAEAYSGTVCRSILSAMSLSCGISEVANGDVYISTQGGDEVEIETQVLMLSSGLQLLSPSLECEEAILPFLCLFAFPLCDSSGELYQPSFGECETLTTEICAREWQMAVSFLGRENLPQCITLPVSPLQCNGTTSAINLTTNISNSTEIMCSKDFYLDMEDSTCKAECGKWKLYTSDGLETAMTTLIILATAIGTISGAVVLILSCINYKKAFAFPSAFVRYEVAILIVYNVVVLISFTDNEALFCSSRDLFASSEESTPYCTFSAVVFLYIYIQLSILWILHIVAIFWGIRFPFQAHRFEATGKNKYLHLAVILLTVILPWISVGAAIGPEGITFPRFPPIICTGDSRIANFYSYVLPIAIIDVVGCSLLVLIFWMIYKNRQITAATAQYTRTPEVKILFIICYFLGIGIFALILFATSYWKRTVDSQKDLSEYLLCESIGMRQGISCADERSALNGSISVQILFDIAFILLGSFPAVNLIYAVNISDLKQKCKKRFPNWFATELKFDFTTKTFL